MKKEYQINPKNLLIYGIMFFFLPLLKSQTPPTKWLFGARAGLDFNSVPPVALLGSSMNAGESSGSISDVNGNLLFYTNGSMVWDRNHNMMPNGIGLLGSYISAQTATIVPLPGNNDLYYIFTMQDWTTGGNGLHYSIVDMAQNMGNGAVISKNNLLHVRARESLAVTKHCNGIDYWVTFFDPSTRALYSYLLTSAGISATPVVSYNTSMANALNRFGYLRFSPNGKRLAFALGDGNGAGLNTTLEIYDFDNLTGVISNPQALENANTLWGLYSCEFSPNSSVLYAVTYSRSGIYQYDLTAGSTAQIISSRTDIGSSTSNQKTGLQLGPDGKIYVSLRQQSFVGVIDDPNQLGCSYIDNAISITGTCNLGFPSLFYVLPTPPRTANLLGPDTSYCPNLLSALSSSETADTYLWNDGSNNDSLYINTVGTYWIEISKMGCIIRDTVTISTYLFSHSLGPDTTICPYDSVVFTASIAGAEYLWNTGNTSSSITSSNIGDYWLDITLFGCTQRDSVKLDQYLLPNPGFLGPDTSVCVGQSVSLSVPFLADRFLWNTGATDSFITTSDSGIYWLDVMVDRCVIRDSIAITLIDLPSPYFLGPDTHFCTGTAIDINISIPGAFINWNTGSTNTSLNVSTPGLYWANVTVNGCSRRDSVDVLEITVPFIPITDTFFCSTSFVPLTSNPFSNVDYIWNTGFIGNSIIASTEGDYWVDIFYQGCTKRDSVFVDEIIVPYTPMLDTSFCEGASVLLSANSIPTASYLWNTGATGNTVLANSVGQYWIDITYQTCVIHDSVNVTEIIIPLDLGPDKTICDYETYLITSNISGASYMWNNGSTNSSLLVNQDNWYWVDVTKQGCTVRDSVNVTVFSFQHSLGLDQFVCPNGSTVFNASISGAQYHWNTGSVHPSIEVSTAGIYWLDITLNNCTKRDSVVFGFNTVTAPNLGPDEVLCGEIRSKELMSNIAAKAYLWSTGSTDPSIIAYPDAEYVLQIVDFNDCISSDTIMITRSTPKVSLGEDVLTCVGEHYTLNAKQGDFVSYEWNTGDRDETIHVKEDGEYIVFVKDKYGCYASDTVNYTFSGCSLYIPSAFTPDGDNLNNLFNAVGENIEEYELQIFNRWGEFIYGTSQLSGGWDGTYHNAEAPQDVYSYVLKYRGKIREKEIEKYGQVTLVR